MWRGAVWDVATLGDDVLLYEQVVVLCRVTRLDEVMVVVSQIEVVVAREMKVVVVVQSEMEVVQYHK